jgi:NTP pyrophosphatase (non-canonical NTP hydrolase)
MLQISGLEETIWSGITRKYFNPEHKEHHLISAELRERLLKFRKDRDWEQFHSARTLAIALSVEAGELLEHFQWISEQDVSRLVSERQAEIAEEIADLVILLTYLTNDLSLDLEETVKNKLILNEQKYPIEKFKGSPEKYSRR